MPVRTPKFGNKNNGDVFIPDDVFYPKNVRPSCIPLTIVCGPPAAGKSTYVKSAAAAGDLVIDLDDIIHEIFGTQRTTCKRQRLVGLEERNRRLVGLSFYSGPAKRAWFITGAASPAARERWKRLLNADEVILLLPPQSLCLQRVDMDVFRKQAALEQKAAINRWFKTHMESE